jgi:hypothetical protein
MNITIFSCEGLTVIHVAGVAISRPVRAAAGYSAVEPNAAPGVDTERRAHLTTAGAAEWAELLRKLAGGGR